MTVTSSLLGTVSLFGISPQSDESFNRYQIRGVKEAIPNVFFALLRAFNLFDPGDYCLKIGAEATHPDKGGIKQIPDFVENCHDKDKRVHAWTADAPEEIQLLIDRGVYVIMTNYPDIVIDFKN